MTEEKDRSVSQVSFEKLAETSPAAITEVDEQGNIVYANSRAEEVLGFKKSEITARTYDDPDWQITDFEGNAFPRKNLPFRIVKKTQEPVFDVRHAIEFPDGERRQLSINATPLFDEAGKFDGMVSVIEDVTDQVKIRRELQRSRERYKKYFEKSGEAIFILKMGGNRHGQILEANPRAEEQTGYSRDELIGLNLVKEISLEPVDMDMNEINDRLSAGETVTFTEKKNRKDGTEYWTEVVVTPLQYEGQRANLSINRDVTERKKVEEKKDHLNSILRSVRNVNQLLVREDDKEELIQGVCEILTETRGYYNAWIALFDESGELLTTAQSGLGEDFESMVRLLEEGEFPQRVEETLATDGVIVTNNPPSTCEDCPLAVNYEGRSSITIRFEYDERVYGMLSTSVPRRFAGLDLERHLFEEVAGDVAFGLHDIAVEEERKRVEESLKRSEKQFRQAIQLAPFPMMIHAEDGEVIAINESWLDITGYEEEELATISDWTKRAYGQAKNNIKAHIDKLYDLEDRIDEGESEIRTKEGEARIWDFSSAPIGRSVDGRRLVLSMADDVTARKQAELKAEEERDMAQRYLDIAGSIIVLIDNKGNVKEINQKGCKILGYKKEEVVGKNWYDNFVPEDVKKEVLEDTWNPLMEGDLKTAKRYENPILTKSGEEKIIAWENTVVREEGQIVGTLSSGIDITERKDMERQIEKDREELQQSFIQLAETTSRVLGVRDPYTQEHEQRVAKLARKVGERMGLDEDKLLGLYLGGVLHDIGKIAIPETILTKPGELKEVEWQMIRSHPEVGYNQILKDTDFPWPVAEMTLHHHERLDGSGYPDGLEGDELTIEVRILGAVDVVEAMSTRRPYREARTREETLKAIKEGKGNKYDPEVVDILIRMIDEGEIQFGGK